MTHDVAEPHSLIRYLEDSPRLPLIIDWASAGWVERSETQRISTDLVGFRSSTQPALTGEAGEAGEPARSAGGIVLADLSAEVVNALPHVPGSDVPVMPDRIIAATALCLGMPLISRDRRIRASGVETIW